MAYMKPHIPPQPSKISHIIKKKMKKVDDPDNDT